MKALLVHIEGQVQGVGFRPFVWRLARIYGLHGWVSNGADGVHIAVEGEAQACHSFLQALTAGPPPRAVILRSTITETTPSGFTEFSIRESSHSTQPNLLITPDLGMCEACKEELLDPASRRYGYAFTTCTQCGPRYSIMRKVPYDRLVTTMDFLPQCPECASEYNNPSNRRFYAQTNSCPQCAVTLTAHDLRRRTHAHRPEAIFNQIISTLTDGGIVAVKGIGGYLLLCDATRSDTVGLLRTRKQRPTKPFALLYRSIGAVQDDCHVSEEEASALTSIESPIVLLKRKDTCPVAPEVAPRLRSVGVMLPYTPLMVWLMELWQKPLVATSANESGSPIYFDDVLALTHLAGIADLVVSNNREILVPQDDSVVRFDARGHRIMIRRSRGYAPTYLPHPFTGIREHWLAMGSDMKSAFALLARGHVYASQYLGDLGNYLTQQSYLHTLNHWRDLLQLAPGKVLVDKHPGYFSATLGDQLAADLGVSVERIQHHEAHFGAVLAENDLLHTAEPVLGVIWDGTGWGDDGAIWGGEFFRYEQGRMTRVAHLPYFAHVLGDKLSREPRLSALSIGARIPEALPMLREKFTDVEWGLYRRMLNQGDTLRTSSVGRLFDAVASMLNCCDRSSYEGEAALLLEDLAATFDGVMEWPAITEKYSGEQAMFDVLEGLRKGWTREAIAYHFHLSLVAWMAAVAGKQNICRLAFSGGVFQNAVLVQAIRKHLGDRMQLYFHHQLSPNDENISVGQLACIYARRSRSAQRSGQEESFHLN